MKKCPTCDKTFDDNLKFCQLDGTPLVKDEPVDPYKTMVANQADLPIPPEKPKEKVEEKPKPPEKPMDPYKTMVAGTAPPVDKKEQAVEAKDDPDLKKTMIASSKTSGDINKEVAEVLSEVKAKKEEEKDTPPPSPFSDSAPAEKKEKTESKQEAKKPEAKKSPDLEAKKTESKPAQPSIESKPKPPQSSPPKVDSASKADKPTKKAEDSKPSLPIPSPFDESMPPGYAPPSTPPFDPSEPVKAEKVGGTTPPVKEGEVKSGQKKDSSPTPAPLGQVKDKAIGEHNPAEIASSGEGQNQTFAYISLACGILSMTICCSAGILLGPAGIILGFMARSKINEDPEAYGGGMLALIGMITGGIGTLLFFGLIILQVFLGGLANFG